MRTNSKTSWDTTVQHIHIDSILCLFKMPLLRSLTRTARNAISDNKWEENSKFKGPEEGLGNNSFRALRSDGLLPNPRYLLLRGLTLCNQPASYPASCTRPEPHSFPFCQAVHILTRALGSQRSDLIRHGRFTVASDTR